MDTASEIAKAISQEMVIQNRTLKGLADDAAIPYSTFYRKMKGGDDFKFGEVYRIAQVLNVRPSQFTPQPFREEVSA